MTGLNLRGVISLIEGRTKIARQQKFRSVSLLPSPMWSMVDEQTPLTVSVKGNHLFKNTKL